MFSTEKRPYSNASRKSISSTMVRASPSVSTNSSAAGRYLSPEIPTATMKCSAGTTKGGGPRFGMIVHHTDVDRQYAYDRESHFGKLDKALTEADSRKWLVVDMKADWRKIYAFEN
jgi:hypothetical protein